MSIKIVISAAVVSAIISGVVSIITSWIAKRSASKVAEETTRREIEKLKQTWVREDQVAQDRVFSEMVTAVSQYLHYSSFSNQTEALVKVASVLAFADRELSDKLQALTASLKCRPPRDGESCLQAVIDCRKSANHN